MDVDTLLEYIQDALDDDNLEEAVHYCEELESAITQGNIEPDWDSLKRATAFYKYHAARG